MKKHIIILAAAITPLAFFSCKKEKIETQQTDSATNEITFKPIIKPVIDIKGNLEGMYQFDGNLKDQTGQLADAVATISGADVYTDDRKGNANSAIKFTGRYGLNIFKVPLTFNTTVAAWVKYDAIAPSTNYFVTSEGLMPSFAQDNDNYWGIVWTPGSSGVPSGPMDNNWHHLVATYDGNEIKFYVDGSFIGTSLNPSQLALPQGATVNYEVGSLTPVGGKVPSTVWFGSLDDLHFYTRVLSSADVKALYQL
jgi:Concanavalin A-like lectin/glucanases superfamily